MGAHQSRETKNKNEGEKSHTLRKYESDILKKVLEWDR